MKEGEKVTRNRVFNGKSQDFRDGEKVKYRDFNRLRLLKLEDAAQEAKNIEIPPKIPKISLSTNYFISTILFRHFL